jgi:Raf kinase inhibitor-like YbhB/YbcL family protein
MSRRVLMMSLKLLLGVLISVVLTGWAPPAGSVEAKMAELVLVSPMFGNNGFIPKKYTCQGKDVNPPLAVEKVPDGTKSLALIVDDPDAPAGTWVHWVVWDIAPETREIPEDTVPPQAKQGVNDFKKREYGGPCPPFGTHRYFFKLYALDNFPEPGGKGTKPDLLRAMREHIIAEAELVGLYRKE